MEESYSVLRCTAIYTKARIIRLCIWSRVVPQGLELQRKKRRGMRTQPWRSSSAFSFSILSTGCSFFICVTPILIFSFKYSRLSIVDPSPGSWSWGLLFCFLASASLQFWYWEVLQCVTIYALGANEAQFLGELMCSWRGWCLEVATKFHQVSTPHTMGLIQWKWYCFFSM